MPVDAEHIERPQPHIIVGGLARATLQNDLPAVKRRGHFGGAGVHRHESRRFGDFPRVTPRSCRHGGAGRAGAHAWRAALDSETGGRQNRRVKAFRRAKDALYRLAHRFHLLGQHKPIIGGIRMAAASIEKRQRHDIAPI
jgi:hypothetical protein